MTFNERLTALDPKLDVSTSKTLTKKKKNQTEEEQKARLEELEEVEKEQQNVLHDMGIDFYAAQDLQLGTITVDLEHQEKLARQEEKEERARDLQKIQYQQTHIMREQKHEIWDPVKENQ